jgi:sialate O-acetylesterase
MTRFLRTLGLFFLLGCSIPAWAATDNLDRPFVSPVFGDNMVLQRDQPNTLWGWTTPGETVRVQIGDQAASGVADATGRWQVRLLPPPAGHACTIRIDGAQHVEFKNVLVGDVWLCGGQSNMQFGLPRAKNGAAEVAAANYPKIRLLKVPGRAAYNPVAAPRLAWTVCSPTSVAEGEGFSAVAYFFARRVQAETGIPIGLVEDCMGGTPAECWMSPAAAAATHQFDVPLAEIARLREKHTPEYGSYIMHWYDEYDVGLKGTTWADPALNDSAWKNVKVPGGFAELGLTDVPAVVWFRRDVTLPDPLPKGDATLRLGVVEKMETSYVNGQWVGASSWVENPRRYRVAAKALKPGRNTIAVRVFKLKSKTGFLSTADQIHLTFADGTDLPLAGEWKAAVSVDARPPHPLPLGFENYPIMPTVLYHGMIQPLVPLALKGALWYQGEANASRAHQYRLLLPALIRDWRAAFGQGDFPFLIAGLPAFQARKTRPGSDDWAELREAQAYTAGTVPNCGLAVTIDTGDAADIHPTDKMPVGERLALLALAKTYGKDVVCSGPTFRAVERQGHELRVTFDHTDGGLTVHGDKPEEFSVAGEDRQWHWADAKLDGDAIVVSSPEVPNPVAVRYAWQANPKATLFNGAGLPAAPFRSDDWPGVTDHAAPW